MSYTRQELLALKADLIRCPLLAQSYRDQHGAFDLDWCEDQLAKLDRPPLPMRPKE